ncbi:MAG: hypothetical protein KIT72_11110 [Polyangiaceae bacterium]|nr:hypothetical protein [Polyangiaceae bacterium]MCW5790960.1 hypothetical protein [Polyangiaceae bacterium]
MKRLTLGLAFALATLTPLAALAQDAEFSLGAGADVVPGEESPPADSGVEDEELDEPSKPKPVPWSLALVWDNSATTDTVGIGQDRQSVDPTYDMSFALRPGYKIIAEERWSLSVSGEIGAMREFTNSNITTREGEWSLTDARLQAGYNRLLMKDGDFATTFGLALPVLTFPTSKISANTGRILGLGTSLSLGQSVPLLGSSADALQTFTLTGAAGYSHTLTKATTPVNGDFQRSRITPSGLTAVSDQLSTGMLTKHQASFTLAGTLGITQTISWTNSFSWRPGWKYQPSEAGCVAIVSGCVEPDEGVAESTDFSVVTVFASEVGMQVLPEFSFALGYANGTLQLGPEGERRNMLYSPDARVYLTLVGHIDAMVQRASGSGSTAGAGSRQIAAR